MKKYVKTFVVSLAVFGVLTTGKLSTTASAHELILDYNGREILAEHFTPFTQQVRDLMKDKKEGNYESRLCELRTAMARVTDVSAKLEIEEEKELSLVLEDAYISPEQFCIFLEDLNFPLKVVFKNVKGELRRPSEGFSKYVTFDCSESKELFLTQVFLSEMRRKITTGGIDLKEMPKNDQSNESGHSVFFGYDSKFWEDKDKKDEQTFCAEEPKKKEAGKKSDKAERWISKNGGVGGALRQGVKDYKEIKKLVSEKKDIWSAINGVAQILKIKELGYKPEQGEK